MIKISRKEDCVGCEACVQRCPQKCIALHEDEQGFLYPKVNLDLCIECHLCERVCPVINQAEPRKPLKVYAAKNTDEAVRLASSSGGVFFALAKYVIDRGGVVFGARFNDDWEVVHGYAETLEGAKAFQGSKYVQSRIGDTYRQAESFLKAGRMVMFTGTPCQLAGLRLFLRKDYGEQLLSVDVVCHGVPSPLVWREYLKYITRPKGASAGKNSVLLSLKDKPVITGISFRDKRLGWEKFGFSVRMSATDGSGQNTVFQSGKHEIKEQELLFEPLDKNIFMRGFLKNLYLRPSCYVCPTKRLKSGSDITIADFWKIELQLPEFHDDKGVSLILVNTSAGWIQLNKTSVKCIPADYKTALLGNSALVNSVVHPYQSKLFWQYYPTDGIMVVDKLASIKGPSIVKRILHRIQKRRPYLFKKRSSRNIWIADISGKVDLYDNSLADAIRQAAPEVSVKLLIPGKGLLSLVPRRFMTSTFFVKRLAKAVEVSLNYLYTLLYLFIIKPDILHLQWLPYLEFNGLESYILKLLRIISPQTKLILTIHNVYPHNMNEGAKSEYNVRFRKVSALFDAFIVHTKDSKESVIKEFGLSKDNVHVCCHGVFIPLSIPSGDKKRADGKLHILQFGSQSYYKGTDILVDAVCGLDNTRKNKIETHIVGGIGQSFLNELKRKDTDSIIKWKAFFLKDEELYREIYNSDIIVLPYRAISQSGVLLLSIYFNKLIICSNLPSFVETMRGASGDDKLDEYMFFKTEDAESLKNLLMRYIDRNIDEDALRNRIKHLKGIYSWENAAKTTLNVYQEYM